MNKAKSNPSHENELNNTGNSRLVLYNDDINEFRYVVRTLEEIFGFDEIQAHQLTLLTHYKGRMIIKEDNELKLSNFQKKLAEAGLSSDIIQDTY